MEIKTIRQSVTFSASPKEIYDMLMDSRKHAKFTGAKAKISDKVGGSFTAWDGYIIGKNVELVPGKKIVQMWRSDEEGWPKDHFSKITYHLTAGSKKGTTKLTFSQSGLPAKVVKSITSGWKEYYWEPMKEYLKNL